MKKATSKYSKEMIQSLLLGNPKAIERGILAIYKNQTSTEQAAGVTLNDNGIGFTGADSFILSSFAVQLKRGWNLSAKQMVLAQRKMPKYWKQLIKIAEERDTIRQNQEDDAILRQGKYLSDVERLVAA